MKEIFFKDAENYFNLVNPGMDERVASKKCLVFRVPGYGFPLESFRLKVTNFAVINQREKERRTRA